MVNDSVSFVGPVLLNRLIQFLQQGFAATNGNLNMLIIQSVHIFSMNLLNLHMDIGFKGV